MQQLHCRHNIGIKQQDVHKLYGKVDFQWSQFCIVKLRNVSSMGTSQIRLSCTLANRCCPEWVLPPLVCWCSSSDTNWRWCLLAVMVCRKQDILVWKVKWRVRRGRNTEKKKGRQRKEEGDRGKKRETDTKIGWREPEEVKKKLKTALLERTCYFYALDIKVHSYKQPSTPH